MWMYKYFFCNFRGCMKVINKPAILISWPRELDMFSVFSDRVLENAVIIVDDFIYAESERFENGKSIIKLLGEKVEYVLLSEILGKVKYSVLFSTGGQTFQKKVTYSSYFKYIYAISIGSFIYNFGLSKVFLDVINRPLTGGGKCAEKSGKYPIERAIGNTVIKYPKGLDVNRAQYPESQWKDVFDVYLCHSDIDMGLIINKFPGAECVKIGYPRYDNVPSVKDAKRDIYNEIKNLDTEKPLLLWMPTIIRIKEELIDNIRVWSDIIKNLLSEYNVLIGVHPKLAMISSTIISDLEGMGFLVDATKGRNLGVLYQSSDLVLADYGGPVLSTIYMKKKLILLNSPSKKYAQWRRNRMYIDDDVRDDVSAFDIHNGVNLIKQIKINIKYNDSLNRDKLKDKYFGKDCNYEYLREIFSKLIK